MKLNPEKRDEVLKSWREADSIGLVATKADPEKRGALLKRKCSQLRKSRAATNEDPEKCIAAVEKQRSHMSQCNTNPEREEANGERQKRSTVVPVTRQQARKLKVNHKKHHR